MSFSFEILKQSGSIVICLRGKMMTDLDLTSVSQEVKEMIEQKSVQLIFNLQELEYINSSGINLFMRTLTSTRTNNGDLVFCNVHGSVEKLFKIAKLIQIYTIYATQEEAVNHFKHT